jgi:drug/metabolite transporter (DMT)-like permease
VTPLLALTGALIVGTSDFIGGYLARRTSVYRVGFGEQLSSLAAFLLLAFVVPAPRITSTDLYGGAVAGLGVVLGLLALYIAFQLGPMSALAPIAAVVGALVSAAAGVLDGDAITLLLVVGAAFALSGVVLVTQDSNAPGSSGAVSRKAVAMAFLAGIAFAGFFIGLSKTSPDAGVWPLVAARSVGVPIIAFLAWRKDRGFLVERRHRGLNAAGGLIGSVATVFTMVALQRGPVIQAVVLGALYPFSTVFLARAVLHESLRPIQWVGVAFALIGIPLIAVG